MQYLLVIGLVILMTAAMCRGDPKLHFPPPTEQTSDNYNEVQYDYRYAIDDPSSGVISDRWEQRYGEYVKGAYSVLDPDGKVRTVDYEVDGPKGFHAVIRTQYPSNSLLSYIQYEKSQKQHRDPPVNILTNQRIATASSEFNNQRSAKLHKNLPVNFHSISPNYYLSLIPGQRTNYRSLDRNTSAASFVAASPDMEVASNHNSEQQQQATSAQTHPNQRTNPEQLNSRQTEHFPTPSQLMLPPLLAPSVYSQFTEAIPQTESSSTEFTRTFYGG